MIDSRDDRPPLSTVNVIPLSPSALIGFASGLGISFSARNSAGVMRPTSATETFMRRFADYVCAVGLDVPPLAGIAHVPVLGRREPGYDPVSRFYLTTSVWQVPPPIPKPTRDDAEAALSALLELLRGFPFATPADRSAAITLLLTSVSRPALALSPGYVIDSPTPGTGKSLLSGIAGVMATGAVPATIALSRRAEENEKRLIAAACDGEPVLSVDNVSSQLGGEFLASLLTSETVKIRPLGSSRTVRLDSRSLFIANGNNIRVSFEMGRRLVRCRLDAGMANPDERTFDFDPLDYALRNRPQLVRHVLTILDAYDAAGRPGLPRPFGNFGEWNVIRGAVMWLGAADPMGDRSVLFDFSDEAGEKLELFGVLYRQFAVGQRISVKEMGCGAYPAFCAELAQLLEGGTWNAKMAGWLLYRHRDSTLSGLTLRCSKAGKKQLWWLDGEPDGDMLDYIADLPWLRDEPPM